MPISRVEYDESPTIWELASEPPNEDKLIIILDSKSVSRLARYNPHAKKYEYYTGNYCIDEWHDISDVVEWWTFKQQLPNDLEVILIEYKNTLVNGFYFKEGFVFTEFQYHAERIKLEDIVCWTYDPIPSYLNENLTANGN